MPETPKTTPCRKSLGLVELVSLGLGGTIGSGIFVVPSVAAGISGPASIVAWLIVAVSASCVLISLAGISARFGQTGGFFGLFSEVFGERTALLVTVLYLVSSAFGVATIAAGIGQYLDYLGEGAPLFIEIGILALFCTINVTGISLSATAENVMTVLKTVPLVIIALLLLPHIRPENFALTAGLSASSLITTIIIVYWPFTGFEISAIPVEETKDIALIRRSLLLVMVTVTLIYILLNIALIGSVGSAALAASPAPVAAAAGLIFPFAGPVVAIIGIIAMLSALNAYIIATSRVLWNIARKYSLPLLSGRGRLGTPTSAIVSSCIVCAGLLLVSNRFDALASVSVITTLIPYIFFCLSAFGTVAGVRSKIVAIVGALSTAVILILFFFV